MEAEISCGLKFKNRSTCKTQKLMISASIEQLKTRGLSIYIIVSKIKAIEDTSSNIMTRNTYYEKLLVILFKNTGYKIIVNLNSILCEISDQRTNEILQQFALNELSRICPPCVMRAREHFLTVQMQLGCQQKEIQL